MDLLWQIRKATAADAEGLEACMQSAYSGYQERMQGMRLPPMEADYSAEIQEHHAWVAESNGAIIGGLIMQFENLKATLANIAVAPAYQGHGIGSALIRFAESTAKEKGYADLHLTTHVLLKENISLYRQLGWKQTGSNKNKVSMKKKL